MIDENLLDNILKDNGVALYDMELVEENDQKIFRVYITSDKEITLDKCAQISNIISPIIDTDPPTKDSYFLEVSSPGIERALKKPRHYQHSIGEKIKIKVKNEESFIAKLIKADNNSITIEKDGDKKEIPYCEILRARTYFEW